MSTRKPANKPALKSKPVSKSKIVKVHSKPRKSRKLEKHNILVSSLREAAAHDSYITREVLAERVGTTVGSINVMLSDLRKDSTILIERSKEGYRMVDNKVNVVSDDKLKVLTTMLREAGKCNNVFITKEQAAMRIGLTPLKIVDMISEISKDTTINVESTERGYRIVDFVSKKGYRI